MHLSTGKLVSDRILELLDEVRQRGMVPCEILLGEKAYQLLRREMMASPGWKQFSAIPFDATVASVESHRSAKDLEENGDAFTGIAITPCKSESPEYVAIDCHI